VEFPHTHNLAILITKLKKTDALWPDELDIATQLTEYAANTRYPGDYIEPTEQDYREAIEIAQKVFDWTLAAIAKKTEA